MENDKNSIIVSLLELQTNFENQFKTNNQYNENNNVELLKNYNELLTTTISNTIKFIYNNKTKVENKKYKHNNKVSLDDININYDQLSKLK
jgi:hypothetical protein